MSTAEATDILFSPIVLGAMKLQHRIALAPMTRNRAIPSNLNPDTFVPCPLMAEYYTQRTTEGGLIISEALPISLQAADALAVPGIFTEEQIEAWKPIVDAVHQAGGIFVAQLWHQGRTRTVKNEYPIISSSAVPIVKSFNGLLGLVPKPMSLEDIERVKEEYAQAATNCIKAGFDGVEIHSANGYLPEQFLHSNINRRDDKYGGSPENRNRFVLEICQAVTRAIGPDRFGLRLSPYGFFNEAGGGDRVEQWTMLCRDIKGLGWAYIHFMEPRYDEIRSGADKLAELGADNEEVTLDPFVNALGNCVPVIVAGGYDAVNVRKSRVLEDKKADVVAFGRYFTSNPDLVYRLKHNRPLVQLGGLFVPLTQD
ncbi:NADPH dehydrogenase [Cryptococcus deuterogattii 99/473]|uniref:Unplaced genomic scaffold supercont1.9, whole genome shotgun sequence n=1 Tax=Cryptococcus deuterogattii Ram5 TaxID=1296110 RepID=A0A0D0V4Y9_9TREE|nr:NADPH dehydrogenase [Cryptococcus deuterogattii MMRL2647]KIR40005.1 NADPH dehydrogenase [Cryptococcus deuterogattii Ram5]KIR71399.1 NADPH dehydrogenase [Cryptococcus deuterogattii CA1014]KIR96269.1 NADPH dehydrogenase [Cryptococcus deuterogattii 2001/935-1]KIY55710.1 NADPH dehydrogenase [Cryptococcus deuterogattii 99/473]